MERIGEMSRKELIRILSRTGGKLEEALWQKIWNKKK
jgi:hypothetical protein